MIILIDDMCARLPRIPCFVCLCVFQRLSEEQKQRDKETYINTERRNIIAKERK